MSLASSTALKVVFAGTPDFAAQHLQALLASRHKVVAVYTQPDRPAGRGKKLQASPVKQLALDANIAVYQPESLKDADAQQALASIDFDIMVVVAYGLLLPKAVLDIPPRGCVNVHGSLLPQWRGAAPIQRAIWAGDKTTGVTIMNMDIGLDTGDMLLKSEIAITADDTSASLYEKLANVGPQALIEALDKFDSLVPEKQNDELASYAKKLDKAEGLIDWQQDGQQIERNIRAFNPWPGTWFELDDKNIKVWQAKWQTNSNQAAPGTIISVARDGIEVQTGNGSITLLQLQIPGKKAQPVSDIINARPDWFKPGQKPGANH
ncbi:methionyl-tRNA formyltransferase [Planctobacterium marinum]|uniref:methionyl-tRNA formyltransferase n=1 Tax=Planctobacterium marinum TaxID=1631968 RepID=UPI001E58E145|nr:methionyl-tRNA formyltransferase [Planctobacterium marinum]MCC2607232.1 methionyl-tRNA formyltransferase [Planctobacterium marinum]